MSRERDFRSVIGMSTVITALIAVAVVVLVIIRRFSSQPVNERRYLILPIILIVIGVRDGKLISGQHATTSAVLLVAEIVVAVAMGLAIGFTTRVWRDDGGRLWSKGTKATAGVFAGSLLLRGAMYGIGAALGVHTGTGTILVYVAIWLLAQYVAIVWRASRLESARGATFVS
jgi:membrane protein CcdC involved in cytochrome C biogenesis